MEGSEQGEESKWGESDESEWEKKTDSEYFEGLLKLLDDKEADVCLERGGKWYGENLAKDEVWERIRSG